MAYQRSEVITVSVKMDNSEAKTVRKPATLHPGPWGGRQVEALLEVLCYRVMLGQVKGSH